MDIYQERYVAHQKEKQKVLMGIIQDRHSDRAFINKQIPDKAMELIYNSIEKIPSSCNRKAILIEDIKERDKKQLLGGLLVGGVGWIHRADRILLLISDWSAYKEGLPFMPYLDAGVIVQQVYLVSTTLNIGCCFVNPNVRIAHYEYFKDSFMPEQEHRFCGALALGYTKE